MQQRQMLKRMLGTAVFAMLFGVSSAHAQTGSTSGSPAQGAQGAASTQPESSGASASSSKDAGAKTLSKSDQNIMREIAQANLAEIEAGKVALSQSRNEQVRNYAQKMIDDHQQAQQELEELAQAKGVTLPDEPVKKLSALEGDKFDKQYMQQGGLNDHRNTHRLVERAQTRASDPELKELAAKMEPIISQHLTMARDVTSARSGTSGSQGPAGTSASGTDASPGTSSTSGASDAAGSTDSSSGAPGASSDAGTSDKSGVSGASGSSNSEGPGK